MTQTKALEFSILERVSKRAPMSIDDLAHLFPGCTWNQLFAAINGLSREDKLALRQVDRCTYAGTSVYRRAFATEGVASTVRLRVKLTLASAFRYHRRRIQQAVVIFSITVRTGYG